MTVWFPFAKVLHLMQRYNISYSHIIIPVFQIDPSDSLLLYPSSTHLIRIISTHTCRNVMPILHCNPFYYAFLVNSNNNIGQGLGSSTTHLQLLTHPATLMMIHCNPYGYIRRLSPKEVHTTPLHMMGNRKLQKYWHRIIKQVHPLV